MSIETVLSVLGAHPYLLLFPLVMIEGPVATVCAGALVATGVLDWSAAFAIAATADLAADTLYYLLGRSSRRPRVKRLLHRLGIKEGKLARLEGEVRKNGARALLGAKVFDLAAIPVLIATGLAGMGYARFLAWNTAATVARSALLISLGFFFGEQAAHYLDRTWALVALPALALAAFVTLRMLSKRIFKEDHYEDTYR